jgi:DNA processing protein
MPLARSVTDNGLVVLALPDPEYPPRLRTIDLPPPVLYVCGDPASMHMPAAVAVVGTRRPTEAGRQFAARAAEAIAGSGATIVSGLAYGVDAAAHGGAVRVGTPTVAVIGGGHGRLYPAGHRNLARAIVAGGGAVVSEHAPEVQPSRGTFPRRNRVISGLADATVVVEAGARSGALTTAVWALNQSRALYVMPGRPGDPSVAGSLAFLRETHAESHIVAGIPELLEDLGLGAAARPEPALPAAAATELASAGDTERRVADALTRGATSVDSLVEATDLPPATVLAALTMLEVRGLVVGSFGRYRTVGTLAGQAPRPRWQALLRPRG